LKNFDTLQELKRIEDQLRQNEDEMKNTNMEYKVKLSDQKKKLEKIEIIIKESEEKFKVEIGSLRLDSVELRKKANMSRRREFTLMQNNDEFKKELELLQADLNSKVCF